MGLKTDYETLTEHKKYLVWEACKYPRYLRDDLIQEGYLGLMKAIQNFNPDKKVKLITYAIYYIREYMSNYVRKNHKFYEDVTENMLISREDPGLITCQEQLITRIPILLNSLNEREHDIISNRYLTDEPTYLHVLGSKYSISEERVRQIESNSLLKMRKILND